MAEKLFNFGIDDFGTFRIYDGYKIIAEVCDCGNMSADDLNSLADEILESFGYINTDEKFFTE